MAPSVGLGNQNSKHMKRIILINGLIAGVICGGMFLITIPMYDAGTLNHDYGALIGYSTMTIALSLIFFGVKSYRDKELNGVISFWKAVKVGLLITLVAGLIYASSWEITYRRIGDSFMEKMTDRYMEQMKTEGASETAIAAKRAEWQSFNEMYKSFFVRFPVTVMEITPVGVLLTLLSAALLRRKTFLPPTEHPATPKTQPV